MRPRQPLDAQNGTSIQRIRIWYALLLFVFSVFLVRLFDLQILKHDYYQKAAQQGQFKEYEIPAERGAIDAYDGDKIIPLVLNERRYTLFADPKFITDSKSAARQTAQITGGQPLEYEEKMRADSRYAVLAKKLTKEQKEKLDALDMKGIGTREEQYRTYPQGSLAAQLLGFVNNDGEGKYGIEQFLDSELRGSPGQLRAITDAAGVPLVANGDNVSIQPEDGKRAVLTIDVSMQRLLEDILKSGLEAARSQSGSALILDPNSGAIKAMANYPTYNPAEYFKTEDAKVFNNDAVGSPLEVGSIMKPLTVAAGLDKGAVQPGTAYDDPGYVVVDGAKITNVEEVAGAGRRSITDILQMSLNTGAVYVLKQLGSGEINEQARAIWHDYMTNRYQLGKATGVEQGYEAAGNIPDPEEGYGRGIRYANTAFGQGMTATPIQMAAAMAAVINGGTYYRPHLLSQLSDADGNVEKKQPQVVREAVVSADVSAVIRQMMGVVVEKNLPVANRPGYSVGGKTGTAQFARPEGGYYTDRFNGTYLGFVGGDKPEYVIMVRVNDPKIAGYAGSQAAGPIFASLSNMLIDNFGVTPKTR
jgi:cell division protein FtsI (penicillin-binding protein 3)